MLNPASVDLLKRAREYICGCGVDSDEPCECAECVEATELLVTIESALSTADAL